MGKSREMPSHCLAVGLCKKSALRIAMQSERLGARAKKSLAANVLSAIGRQVTNRRSRNSMSQVAVAFNLNGEPFAVPPTATGWKVRRMRPKGPPEVVYGLDGAPLVLPLDADLQDLRREARIPGRYRLDALDDRQQVIDGAQVAYLYVHEDQATAEAGTEARRPAPLESALIEAMRLNTSLAQSVISQFPAMMDSAAGLLRAADGAGLPSRMPLAPTLEEEDEEDDEREAPSKPSDLASMVSQAMPPLMAFLTSRSAAAASSAPVPVAAPASMESSARQPASVGTSAPAGRERSTAAERPAAAMPAIDPATMAHFLAIRQALSPEEQALAQALLAELSPDQVQGWLRLFAPLPVATAVEKLREILYGDAAPVSPSTGGES